MNEELKPCCGEEPVIKTGMAFCFACGREAPVEDWNSLQEAKLLTVEQIERDPCMNCKRPAIGYCEPCGPPAWESFFKIKPVALPPEQISRAAELEEANQELRESVFALNCRTMQLQADRDSLEAESMVLYAAILEAAELGPNAAGRCKLELQRVARNDALARIKAGQ